MKIKKVILLFSIICAVMLININITQSEALKLDVKIGSLKEAQARYVDPVPSYNVWYIIQGGENPRTEYFGWPECEKRIGWFDDLVECSKPK